MATETQEINILEIKNLTFGYTKDRLLYKNFNLTLKKGEIKGIVGESGSGKSTLFELITDELNPLNGEIKTQKIAQIFQDPYSSFHPTYSIINQIEEVATLDGLEELLKKLHIQKELLYKKPHKLSGGQLQRCSILRAILQKPKLILADEPTSALDNITALSVMKLLVNFLDRVGILLITHDEELAKWCCDEVYEVGREF
jgi:peptide/nickel transport system ATP-binding protein